MSPKFLLDSHGDVGDDFTSAVQVYAEPQGKLE